MSNRMNSTTSFSWPIFRHAFVRAVMENSILLLLGVVVFCIMIPISTAGLPTTSIFNIAYTHDQMKLRFFASQFAAAINFGALLYGALAGIMQFKFLLDKRQTASFLTLGLTRTALFMSRYLAGAVMTAISLLLPMLISLALNIIAFGMASFVISHFFYISLGLLLVGLNGLALSAVACMLAGSLGECLLFSGVIISLPTAVCYSAGVLMRRLLLGNAYGAFTYSGTTEIQSNLTELFSKWNPAIFFFRDLKQYSVFYEGGNSQSPQGVSFGLTAQWVLLVAGLSFLALCLFRSRRAENAGISGLSRLIRIVGLFGPGVALFAVVTDALASFHLPIALLAATVAYLAWSFILGGTLLSRGGSFLHRQIETLALLASVWIIVLVLLGGGVGFSSKIPPASRITSAEVSYVGSPCYLGVKAQGNSTGGGYYVMSSYTYTNSTDIGMVLSLHQNFIDMGRQALGESDEDFSETVLPYDIVFRYTLNNGKVETRYYDRATAAVLEKMLALDSTSRVREIEGQTVAGEGGAIENCWASSAFDTGNIYLSDAFYSNPTLLQLDNKSRMALQACIAKDVANQMVNDRYFPKTPPRYVLMFTQNGETDRQSYRYQMENTLVYVTGQFSNTLAFLKEHGFETLVSSDETVESITLQRFSPFGVINGHSAPQSLYFQGYVSSIGSDFISVQDFGLPYEVTDKEKLSALEPLLRNDYFMSGGGYLASVKLAGSGRFVYKFLPAADAPDYVSQALG